MKFMIYRKLYDCCDIIYVLPQDTVHIRAYESGWTAGFGHQ